jgi:tripartite-type tricarboxylate transporter receptor subunit TctC
MEIPGDTPMPTLNLARRTLVCLAALAPAFGAIAQSTGDWPTKGPIKLIVPGPPGGGMDIFARLLQVPMQNALKQTIVMDFKPGANSIIGIDALAKSAPDGYTILIAPSSAIAINPVIQPKLPFNVQKDLAPVAQVGAAGILLMTNPSTGFKTLKDMVSYAKANPGKLAYGSWGYGSTGHLVMEGIKANYGLDMPHIPYKTTAQEVTDLLSGNLQLAFTDIASPVPHIKAGKLVSLGVTGSSRGPALPDLPTVTEQGYKFDADGWFGIFAPAGTPQPIIDRLNAEIGKAMALDDTRAKFAQRNMAVPPHKTAAQFAATVKSDIALWQDLARKAKLKID